MKDRIDETRTTGGVSGWLLQPAKVPRLLPKRPASGRTRRGRTHRRRRHRQPGAARCAVARGADAVLVHHGYFWKGEDGRITGIRRQRLKTLLAHDISLLAYHLPLDAHPELGNNAQLAARLGWLPEGVSASRTSPGWGARRADDCGTAVRPARRRAGAHAAAGRRCRAPGAPDRLVHGGRAGLFRAGDRARRRRLTFPAKFPSRPFIWRAKAASPTSPAGTMPPSATAWQALAEHLTRHCGLQCEFVDLDNPV
jgi:putative NIF3 family GTP cyclohydrolase 1 type 2